MNEENEFCIPFKRERTLFKKCEECKKRKISTHRYEMNDAGLVSYVDYWVCNKCMKEAKERVKNMLKCTSCGDVTDRNHKTLCEYCREKEKWEKEQQ